MSEIKSLDEAEPRVPIRRLPFTIEKPGSYILTGDLMGELDKDGIVIDADSISSGAVSIDLMGFSLVGPGSGTGRGIVVVASEEPHIMITPPVSIRNGSVMGWGGDGVNLLLSPASNIWEWRVFENGGNGIVVGADATLVDCNASGNGGAGIVAAHGSSLTNCTAAHNIGVGINAIVAPNFLTDLAEVKLVSCIARKNGGDGFLFETGGLIRDSLSSDNGGNGIKTGALSPMVETCVATSNTQSGIVVGEDALVRNSTATGNGLNGIVAAHGSSLVNCTVALNVRAGINVIVAPDMLTDVAATRVVSCLSRKNGEDGFLLETGGIVKDSLAFHNGSNGFNASTVAITMESCVATSNSMGGIVVGEDALVSNSTANDNGLNGIVAAHGSSLVDCTAALNVRAGINVIVAPNFLTDVAETRVMSCVARKNGEDGFLLGTGGIVKDSLAFQNGLNGFKATAFTLTMDGCVATSNTKSGILLQGGGSFAATRCKASFNGLAGFGVNQASRGVIMDSQAFSNTGAGIHLGSIAAGIRINNCSSYGNDWGYLVESSSSLLIKNSATDNSTGDFQNTGDSAIGPIIDVDSVNPSPWANIAF